MVLTAATAARRAALTTTEPRRVALSFDDPEPDEVEPRSGGRGRVRVVLRDRLEALLPAYSGRVLLGSLLVSSVLLWLFQVIRTLGERGPVVRRRGTVTLRIAAIHRCVASGRQIHAVGVAAVRGGKRFQVRGVVALHGDLVTGVGLDVPFLGGVEDPLHCLEARCETSFAFRQTRVALVCAVSLVVLGLNQEAHYDTRG